MQLFVCFDYCALVVLLVLFFYLMRTNKFKNEISVVLMFIMGVILICTISDIVRTHLQSYSKSSINALLFFNSLFILSESLIAPAYSIYLVVVTDTWHRIRCNTTRMVLFIIPVGEAVIGILCNIKFKFIFDIDNAGNFVRGSGYFSLYIVALFYFCAVVHLCFYYRKYLGNRRFFAMIIPIFAVMLVMAFQIVVPNSKVMLFVLSMAAAEIILINRRTEATIDLETGFGSANAFVDEIGMSFISKNESGLVLINVTNYHTAINVSNYEEVINCIKEMAGELKNIGLEMSLSANYYYLGSGRFVIRVRSREFERLDEVIRSIHVRLIRERRISASNMEFAINICRVMCPEDVNDVDSLFMIINDLDNFPVTGKVINASDFTHTEEFVMKKEINMIIDRALVNNYLEVYYQPIYSTKDNRFKSCEALIRLKDPDYGMVSPGVFIPVAEKSGAIHKIGSFVLEEVCKFIGSDDFKRLGLSYVEINLSAMQCLRSDLCDEIINITHKYHVKPSMLNLEITETATCYAQARMISNIKELNARGFEISLDDFGTGYSNMMRIASLPLSIIKLDRAFVIMEEDPEFRIILKNMVTMFKEMGMYVLVEGIETQKLADDFIEFGVDYIQGYFYSKPLCKKDYIEFLEKHLED